MARIGKDLNDGEYHHISMSISRSNATVLLNAGVNCTTGSSCYAEIQTSASTLPQFSGPLYIAGIEQQTNATQFHLENALSLICSFTMIQINHFPIVYNFVITSMFIDLEYTRSGGLCAADTCSNNQQCIDLWVQTACQCSLGYTGDSCQTLSTVHLDTASGLQFSNVTNNSIGFDFTVQTDSGFILSINKVRYALTLLQQFCPFCM